MIYLMLYFLVGGLSSCAFFGYWWLYKDRVENPASLKLMLIRATAYIFVWPVLYWKWLKSQDKTRFITHPDFVLPELSPANAEAVKLNAQKAALKAQKVQQEWEAFVDALPQCGSHIMYKGTDIYGERLNGRFIFETADLLPVLFDAMHPEPFDIDEGRDIDETDVQALNVRNELNEWINTNRKAVKQEHYIHRWLRTYDPALYVCNVVPNSFDRFEYIASEMIEAGKGQAHCKSCNTVYDASDIKAVDGGQGSWIFGELYCPKEHLLARRKKIHFMGAIQN
ncbi:hypothetical protein FX988_02945 [Paraglaciecola mesophila]|uniref:Uncharacterized protein n=1 Tax=Paraglaciecola mesophila TaxID=197222 RepID=A0A857JP11_9ALTE|nr:hypothetical protein [Paraglaciecola mesophila]QHJ12687.1 hypothetical protein FX988_02945 [Paraglaciecola mesophila]